MKKEIVMSGILGAAVLGFGSSADAAVIAQGDVTTSLTGPTLFVDDASTGGGDATFQEGTGPNPKRTFDLDGDTVLSPPGVAGTVTITGFGFATSAAALANDATSIDLTFTYLGADEVFGGGDDVAIGTETVGYNFIGAGEYFVNLDTSPSALIDGLGDAFRVSVFVNDVDPLVQETIRFKQVSGIGIKLSVAGSFVPVPEPASVALMGLGGLAMMRRGNSN